VSCVGGILIVSPPPSCDHDKELGQTPPPDYSSAEGSSRERGVLKASSPSAVGKTNEVSLEGLLTVATSEQTHSFSFPVASKMIVCLCCQNDCVFVLSKCHYVVQTCKYSISNQTSFPCQFPTHAQRELENLALLAPTLPIKVEHQEMKR
jgi:hypothetical protein